MLILSEYAIVEIEGARVVNVFNLCNENIKSVSYAHKVICWSIENRKKIQEAMVATLEFFKYMPDKELEIIKKSLISLSLDLMPVIGSMKSAGQVIVGKDLVTKEGTNRFVEVLGIIPYAKFITKAKSAVKTGKATYNIVHEALNRFSKYADIIAKGVKKPSFGYNEKISKAIKEGKISGSNIQKIYRETFYSSLRDPEKARSIVDRSFTEIVDGIKKTHTGNVHHAVPQQVLKKYPELGITLEEMHSLENLRGIPPEYNRDIHLIKINAGWKRFYDNNPSTTKDDLFKKAEEIDCMFGYFFYPPVRHKKYQITECK